MRQNDALIQAIPLPKKNSGKSGRPLKVFSSRGQQAGMWRETEAPRMYLHKMF